MHVDRTYDLNRKISLHAFKRVKCKLLANSEVISIKHGNIFRYKIQDNRLYLRHNITIKVPTCHCIKQRYLVIDKVVPQGDGLCSGQFVIVMACN